MNQVYPFIGFQASFLGLDFLPSCWTWGLPGSLWAAGRERPAVEPYTPGAGEGGGTHPSATGFLGLESHGIPVGFWHKKFQKVPLGKMDEFIPKKAWCKVLIHKKNQKPQDELVMTQVFSVLFWWFWWLLEPKTICTWIDKCVCVCVSVCLRMGYCIPPGVVVE